MAITFNCPCGKLLSVPEQDIGKLGVCPHCNQHWKVTARGPWRPHKPHRALKPRDVENFLFGHQRAIWGVAMALVVLVGCLFVWYTGIGRTGSPPATAAAMQAGPAPTEPAAVDPTAAISTLEPTPLGPDAPTWATDFRVFAREVQQASASEQSLQQKFTNYEIRWTVTYDSMHAESVLFFAEALELLGARPPIQVWALLAPSEVKKVAKLKPGDQVVIHGVMGHVTSPRTQNFPAGVYRLGPKYCVIESIQ